MAVQKPKREVLTEPVGYADPMYAASLAEFGRPRRLPRSGGNILVRGIPGTEYEDAMGCYPIFACIDWDALYADLHELDETLVSLVAVTDPFGNYDRQLLGLLFPDLCREFKSHFVADLAVGREKIATSHHRYYARRALRDLRVEEWTTPIDLIESWVEMYNVLIERRSIRGIQAFSRDSFLAQLSLPHLRALVALEDGAPVGAHLWMAQGEVVYSHLAAFTPRGYELSAAYALYWEALDRFASEFRWIDFGAGAGLESDGSDGLSWFKKGWSTGRREVFLCGRVFNQSAYRELSGRHADNGSYFPVYRFQKEDCRGRHMPSAQEDANGHRCSEGLKRND